MTARDFLQIGTVGRVGKIALSRVAVEQRGSPSGFRSALIRELGYFVIALIFALTVDAAFASIGMLAGGPTYQYEYQFKRAELIQTTVIIPGGEKKVFSCQNGILTSQK